MATKSKSVKMVGTPKELSEQTGINVAVLSVLLNLAKDAGKATIIKKVETGGRGRPSNVWSVNESFTVHLGKVAKTEETETTVTTVTEETEVTA